MATRRKAAHTRTVTIADAIEDEGTSAFIQDAGWETLSQVPTIHDDQTPLSIVTTGALDLISPTSYTLLPTAHVPVYMPSTALFDWTGATRGATAVARITVILRLLDSCSTLFRLPSVSLLVITSDKPALVVGRDILRRSELASVDFSYAGGTPSDQKSDIDNFLNSRLDEARLKGAPPEFLIKVRALIFGPVYNIWRMHLCGDDAPCRLPPMRIRLKHATVIRPKKPYMKRQTPAKFDFIDRHTRDLVRQKVIRRSHSDTVAPSFLVPKTDGTFRLVVDEQWLNSQTIEDYYPSPMVSELLTLLVHAEVFASFDFLKGFWQMLVHPEDTHLLAFQTPVGVFEFLRAVMGAMNSGTHMVRCTSHIFSETRMLWRRLLLLIDDALVWGRTPLPPRDQNPAASPLQVAPAGTPVSRGRNGVEYVVPFDGELQPRTSDPAWVELYNNIEEYLLICNKFNLKCHPKKQNFYSTELTYLGWTVSKEGVSITHDRIQGLTELGPPATVYDLQQFNYATIWVQKCIPNYSLLATPITDFIASALGGLGGKVTAKAKRLRLADNGWTPALAASFDAMKAALIGAITTTFPDPEKHVCQFTDASMHYWSIMITQIPMEDIGLPISQQRHEPLAFKSGKFRHNQRKWAIPDKEAYPAVHGVEWFPTLFSDHKKHTKYCDAKNMVYVLHPNYTPKTLPTTSRRRVNRWKEKLLDQRFDVIHLDGEENVWTDMGTRWGAPGLRPIDDFTYIPANFANICMPPPPPTTTPPVLARAVFYDFPAMPPPGNNPYDVNLTDSIRAQARFAWPKLSDIITAQTAVPETVRTSLALTLSSPGPLLLHKGKTFIPDHASLRERIMVVAHQGSMAHRGWNSMWNALQHFCSWPSMRTDAKTFVASCLQCVKNMHGELIPRPRGSQIQPERNGEVLTMDWITMPMSTSGHRYILTIKDSLSSLVSLTASSGQTAFDTAPSLFAWCSTHGTPDYLVTDRGPHFVNALLTALQQTLRYKHHLTTANASWTHGSIENLNRQVIKVFTVLCSEFKISIDKWPSLLPLVQYALNHADLPSNTCIGPDGISRPRSPIEINTGRRPPTQLSSLFWHGPDLSRLSTQLISTTTLLTQVMKIRHAWTALAFTTIHRLRMRRSEYQRRLRKQTNGKASTHYLPPFEVGCYVLVGRAICLHADKIRLRWQGPFKVVKVIGPLVYQVHLVGNAHSDAIREVHAARLRLFADKFLNLTTELIDLAQHDLAAHVINKIVAWRFADDDTIQFKIRWLGFEEPDDSWEYMRSIIQTHRVLVRNYLRKHKHRSIRLQTALDDILSTDKSRKLEAALRKRAQLAKVSAQAQAAQAPI